MAHEREIDESELGDPVGYVLRVRGHPRARRQVRLPEAGEVESDAGPMRAAREHVPTVRAIEQAVQQNERVSRPCPGERRQPSASGTLSRAPTRTTSG